MSAFGSGASLVLRGCHCRLLHTHPLYLWGGGEGRGGEGRGGGSGGEGRQWRREWRGQGWGGEGRGGEGRGEATNNRSYNKFTPRSCNKYSLH